MPRRRAFARSLAVIVVGATLVLPVLLFSCAPKPAPVATIELQVNGKTLGPGDSLVITPGVDDSVVAKK